MEEFGRKVGPIIGKRIGLINLSLEQCNEPTSYLDAVMRRLRRISRMNLPVDHYFVLNPQ